MHALQSFAAHAVVAAVAAETAASEIDLPSSTVDDTNNQTVSSDEQQPPVSRGIYSMDMLQRKPSSNTNSSLSSSTSTSTSPNLQQKCHSRSSSSSSSSLSNSSLQKRPKSNDETNQSRSLNDLSQFVQLNKDEKSFPLSSGHKPSNKKGTTILTRNIDSLSTTDTK